MTTREHILYSISCCRLVEEIKQQTGLQITNDKVYMNTSFNTFTEMLVMNHRGEDTEDEFTYDPVCLLVIS